MAAHNSKQAKFLRVSAQMRKFGQAKNSPACKTLCATKPADINKTNRHTQRPHKNKKQTFVGRRNAHLPLFADNHFGNVCFLCRPHKATTQFP